MARSFEMYGVKPSFESLLEVRIDAALREPQGRRITKGEEYYAGGLARLCASERRRIIVECDAGGVMASFGGNQFGQPTLSIWRKG